MGRLLVVHRSQGEDAGLYHTWADINSTNGGLTWGDPDPMYRSSISGPTLARFNETIYCVYATPEGRLKYTSWNTATNSWAADQYASVNMTDSKVTLVPHDNKLFCIHRGYRDEALYYMTFDGQHWTPDVAVADIKSAAGPGSIVIGGHLYILFCGTPPAYELYGSTYSPSTGWSKGYNIANSDLPISASRPALRQFGDKTYCVHRGGGGNAKNGDQIWTCTLTAGPNGPHGNWQIAVDYSDISNQTYQTCSGPAVVTDGAHMWVFYGSNDEAQNLYYANWVQQDPWKNSYWAGEANVPNNRLWFEPAAIYVP